MAPRLSLAIVSAAFVTSLALPAQQDAKPRPWTLEEALHRLALQPRDPYCQYVALQLAHREEREDTVAQVERLIRRDDPRGDRRADALSLFSGALAVQESLQLDTMRDPHAVPAATPGPEAGAAVAVSALRGPEIESHPWSEMLAGRRPEVSALSRMVPEDFWFAEFRSLNKMLALLEDGDVWGRHFFQQAVADATTHDLAARVQKQLAVETQPLLRPLYDQVVQDVAITGSDLYLREGSDVTLVFRLRQPELFRARMDGFLDNARKARPDATERSGEVLGVPFRAVTTPDRAISVFSAYPRPDVHVRSNSEAALRRVLAATLGKDEQGRAVPRLGDTEELAYIRTLLPYGASAEDGFLYLSDACLRRIVGPRVKLTELHRMRCYNALRMIGHAAAMFRTERGAAPRSFAELASAGCAPGVFGTGALACPDGGRYELAEDGMSAQCTLHGGTAFLVPCCELPLENVPAAEAALYERFLAEYNGYWRTFFDPIAVRVRAEAERYALETVVLPLIDNSIYTGMAEALGGAPQPLDALPVPTDNIATLAFAFDGTPLLELADRLAGELAAAAGMPLIAAEDVQSLVRDGLGAQVSLNLCDNDPLFDFGLPRATGEMLRSGSRIDDDWLFVSFLVASLSAPAYVAIPVRDGAVVDRFLDQVDAALAVLARRPDRRGWFDIETDFYRLPELQGSAVRCMTLGLGPIRWRFFWARVGDGFYVASKRAILESLATARKGDAGPTGHAMLRLRPEHWAAALRDFQLGWAEGNRLACLANLAPLSNVARAFPETAGAELAAHAQRVYGARGFCPDGGEYTLAADSDFVECTVHGSPAAPRQPDAPAEDSELGQLLRHFKGLTATLTFTPEGLRAALEVRKK
jgi:hypothetical protein